MPTRVSSHTHTLTRTYIKPIIINFNPSRILAACTILREMSPSTTNWPPCTLRTPVMAQSRRSYCRAPLGAGRSQRQLIFPRDGNITSRPPPSLLGCRARFGLLFLGILCKPPHVNVVIAADDDATDGGGDGAGGSCCDNEWPRPNPHPHPHPRPPFVVVVCQRESANK